jgi:uncharacterized membrane protein
MYNDDTHQTSCISPLIRKQTKNRLRNSFTTPGSKSLMSLQADVPESAAERVYVIGGTALAVAGMFNRSTTGGLGLLMLGGALVAKGLQERRHNYDAAHGCVKPTLPDTRGLVIERSLVIDRPRAQVYYFWRNLENLPRFMTKLVSVKDHGNGRSTWVAKGPKDGTVTWDAEITEEREYEVISWRSLPGSAIANEGAVFFHALSRDRTEVRFYMDLHLPLGRVGERLAKVFGEDPELEIEHDLERFKRLLEE